MVTAGSITGEASFEDEFRNLLLRYELEIHERVLFQRWDNGG